MLPAAPPMRFAVRESIGIPTWRPRREHLFTLRQSLEAYRYYQDLITRCDQEMEEQFRHTRFAPPPMPLVHCSFNPLKAGRWLGMTARGITHDYFGVWLLQGLRD